MYILKTPQAPPQNNPFPGLNLKGGKMNYSLGKLDPNWAKCLKSGQNFSRSGQKKNVHPSEPSTSWVIENISNINICVSTLTVSHLSPLSFAALFRIEVFLLLFAQVPHPLNSHASMDRSKLMGPSASSTLLLSKFLCRLSRLFSSKMLKLQACSSWPHTDWWHWYHLLQAAWLFICLLSFTATTHYCPAEVVVMSAQQNVLLVPQHFKSCETTEVVLQCNIKGCCSQLTSEARDG